MRSALPSLWARPQFYLRRTLWKTGSIDRYPVDTESHIPGLCIKSRSIFVTHSALTALCVNPATRQLGVTSLSAIPLVINDQVLGVLGVYSLAEGDFVKNKVVSVQFLAKLLRGALLEFQQSKKNDLTRNKLALATATPATAIGYSMLLHNLRCIILTECPPNWLCPAEV